MINKTQRLDRNKQQRNTWPNLVKELKLFPGKKVAPTKSLDILEQLYQNKAAKG